MKIIKCVQELDLEKLAELYDVTALDAYQEMTQYLREDFFPTEGAFYVIAEDYASALRVEPYREGYLIEALQTKKELQNQGYAKALLRFVLQSDMLPEGAAIYSHIHKKNSASLAVHKACGFTQALDYAVFVDGSVYRHSCTMVYHKHTR